MKNWNTRGLKTSLERGRAKPARTKSESTMRLGLTIPIVSRVIANARIRSRESSIKKLGDRIEKLVQKERQKIENVVGFAERTDIRSVYERALSLQDQLEDAACIKVKFKETAEASDVPTAPGLSKEEKRRMLAECVATANEKHDVAWRSGTGHSRNPLYNDWSKTLEDCKKAKGLA